MIRTFLMCFLLFLLCGCVGDRLAFHEEGDAIVSANLICIKSSPGDSLEYYLLSSSVNNYQKPLAVMRRGSPKKYPDTCISVNLEESADYELIYTLNGNNYQFEFNRSGADKIVIKKHRKS